MDKLEADLKRRVSEAQEAISESLTEEQLQELANGHYPTAADLPEWFKDRIRQNKLLSAVWEIP